MAGNTGKMTAAAVAMRGPRFRLISIHRDGKRIGFVIDREGTAAAVRAGHGDFCYSGDPGGLSTGVYAKSYSVPYLRRLVRGVRP